MGIDTRGKVRWLFLASLLLIVAGCSSKSSSSLSGKVTLDGQPVANGYISFYPQEKDGGPTTGCDIKNGEYKISLIPGKKKVHVTVDTQAAGGTEQVEARRGKMNIERRGEARKTPAPSANSKPLTGSDLEVEISSETRTLDIPLETPK